MMKRSKQKRSVSVSQIVIILLVALCATATRYWYHHRQKPPESEQDVHVNADHSDSRKNQTCDGFTLSLKSTVSESNSIYATFGLEAPEAVDLSGVLSIQTGEKLSFPGLLATTGNAMAANVSCDVADDGDGRNNTINVVLKIDPVVQKGEESPFSTSQNCRIEFRDIVKWGYDREREQFLAETKYAGQQGYLLTPEEAAQIHPQSLLVSGSWFFDIPLTQAEVGELELLTSPVVTTSLVIRSESEEFETESLEEVKITSIRVHPLYMEVHFEPAAPTDTIMGVFLDATLYVVSSDSTDGNYQQIYMSMRDGTQIPFFQPEGAKETAILNADSPILLSEIACLNLSDGTKIKVQ